MGFPPEIERRAGLIDQWTRDQKRREAKESGKPARDSALRKKVFERDEGICAECGRFDPKWQHDHIIPLADQGPDTLENSQTKCRHHHSQKTSREATRRAHYVRSAEKHQIHQLRMSRK